ncbi:hypothetical protein BGLA2_700136 [Burkholderia gladioli]|nr:hypothetical protein BGLA2_700136 [Burkholderia gladioli]
MIVGHDNIDAAMSGVTIIGSIHHYFPQNGCPPCPDDLALSLWCQGRSLLSSPPCNNALQLYFS